MNNYETVIIFTPILSDQDVKRSIGKYTDLLKSEGCEIIHEDFWGLKQLAYTIQKKTTGIYLVVEYQGPGTVIPKLELLFRRDPEVLRFLTVKLDKYAVQYNANKRAGKVGQPKKEEKSTEETVAAE